MPQFQKYDTWCGPNSIRNALLVYGQRESQAKIAQGPLPNGMDEHDIIETLNRFNRNHLEFESKRRSDAYNFLKTWAHVAPIILCVDSFNHWVTIIGGCRDRYILADGDGTAPSAKELGIVHLLPKTILKRWRAARKVSGTYYGIVVL